MRVSVFGIPDFPLGKKIIPDERMEKIKEMLKPAKTTYIQLELVDDSVIRMQTQLSAWKQKKQI